MSNACKHDYGLSSKRILKPYYNEEQLICSKCHEIVSTQRVNNLISSFIATQDPNATIKIGEEVYVLSEQCKAVLKQYETVFSLIDQIAQKLPDGQNDSAVLGLFHHLYNATFERLNMLDCSLQLLENDITSNLEK